MDAAAFLGHVRHRQAQLASIAAPALRPVLPSEGAKADIGKPPFGKDRYPASFAGRKPGSKNVAGKKRELKAALAAAVAASNPNLDADTGAPDFLSKFVSQNMISRVMNRLGRGDINIKEAANELARRSQGQLAGPPIGGFGTSQREAGRPLAPPVQALPAAPGLFGDEDIGRDLVEPPAAVGGRLAPAGVVEESGRLAPTKGGSLSLRPVEAFDPFAGQFDKPAPVYGFEYGYRPRQENGLVEESGRLAPAQSDFLSHRPANRDLVEPTAAVGGRLDVNNDRLQPREATGSRAQPLVSSSADTNLSLPAAAGAGGVSSDQGIDLSVGAGSWSDVNPVFGQAISEYGGTRSQFPPLQVAVPLNQIPAPAEDLPVPTEDLPVPTEDLPVPTFSAPAPKPAGKAPKAAGKKAQQRSQSVPAPKPAGKRGGRGKKGGG